MLSASWNWPWLVAPSPKKPTATPPVFFVFARARAGEGPTLLECKTYRFLGHFVGDPLPYRSKEEAEDWMQNRDPLQNFETKATEAGLLSSDDLRKVDGDVEAELAAAVEAAEAAPLPTPADVLTDVYVDQP